MTANLLSRLQGLTSPDREVDALILAWSENRDVRYENGLLLAKSRRAPYDECLLGRIDPGKHSRNFTPQSESQPAFTASLDAAIALCERVLPGWTWRVATCHVSDDAWVIPDFNHPIHGERLMREFGQVEGDPTTYWQEITDVDLRPSGRPAIALLIALLRALEARDA